MEHFASYDEALDSLPPAAVWSSSFGGPGKAGFTEIYSMPDGTRYWVSNGQWDAPKPWTWTVTKMDPPISPVSTCIEHGPGGTIRLSYQIKVF